MASKFAQIKISEKITLISTPNFGEISTIFKNIQFNKFQNSKISNYAKKWDHKDMFHGQF